MNNISEHNASPLIGQSYRDGYGYSVTVIWHQACGDDWPADQDLITYFYHADGNEATAHRISFSQFFLLFDMGPLDSVKAEFDAIR